MDLTFVGWIVVGLLAGFVSGVIAGGRTLRGWMPSLVIGLIAAVLTGWVLYTFLHVDSITSIWVSAVLSAMMAILLRMIIGTFVFDKD
jgi:uncharacterized membrane protein YeaQ/YmgE (transglycosylase-associated protein family)